MESCRRLLPILLLAWLPIVAHADSNGYIELDGPDVPNGHAFWVFLHSNALTDGAASGRHESLKLDWIAKQMQMDSAEAIALLDSMAEAKEVIAASENAMILASICTPEATEWWPDTTALQALDSFFPLREALYQEHYESFVSSLPVGDRPLFLRWFEDEKQGMGMTETVWSVTHKDRVGEAQALLVRACDGLADRVAP